jgi:DNA-directed RNA polymerase subunit RPC12/RpoP
MKLGSTIDLYAAGDSWLVHPPGLKTDTPVVRDMARRRLVRTNPDVDSAAVKCPRCGSTKYGLMPTDFETAKCSKCGKNFPAKSIDAAKYKEKPQTDNAAFIGKRLKVQDIKYGHIISEHDNDSSATQAMLARPYSRILRHPEPQFDPKNRAKTRKKLVTKNPDNPDDIL